MCFSGRCYGEVHCFRPEHGPGRGQSLFSHFLLAWFSGKTYLGVPSTTLWNEDGSGGGRPGLMTRQGYSGPHLGGLKS